MLATFIRRIYPHLVFLVTLGIVLLAVYVSIGRQFMPAISSYTEFFEEQVFEATGVPVSVEAISGSFVDFNPMVNITGLSLLPSADSAPDADRALVFESASIVVDIPRSLWRRQWVLREFVVNELAVELIQSDSGEWRVEGLSAGGDNQTDLATLFQTLQRVSRLDLNGVAIGVRDREGNRYSFGDGTATILNRGQNHFLHVNSRLGGNRQRISFYIEARGNRLEELDGEIYMSLPPADYSDFVRGLTVGQLELRELAGGGRAWVGLQDGDISSAFLEAGLRLELLDEDAAPLLLSGLGGSIAIERQEGGWSGRLQRLSLDVDGEAWSPFSLGFEYRDDQYLSLTADTINLDFLTGVLPRLGVLDETNRANLAAYSPAGAIQNLSVTVPLGEGSESGLALQANVSDFELGSLRGTPQMWGIDGYVELRRAPGEQVITGFAEVESDRFSILIPGLFTSVWDYSYVNGRVNLEVDPRDGQRILLASDVIALESDIVDGHARFSSMVHRRADGTRDAELELMVGATRMDAAQKSAYLPDGPSVGDNLRGTVNYLNRAIVDGVVENSGLIFRGKTLPGTGPQTKTFQGLFRLREGEFEFSPEWPALEGLRGQVSLNDDHIDVAVAEARSLGLQMGPSIGRLRPVTGGGARLLVGGRAEGPLASGLDYLAQAPLDEGLQSAFSGWQVEGDFDLGLGVEIPLGQPANTEIDTRLAITLEDNAVTIPDYRLSMTEVSGEVLFDSRLGLEDTSLTATLFGEPTRLGLSSDLQAEGGVQTLYVDGEGSVTPQALQAWQPDSGLLSALLGFAEGDIQYRSRLALDQTGEGAGNRLRIESELAGVTLDVPAPFTKEAASERDLLVELQFGAAGQELSGNLGPELEFDLSLDADGLRDGYILLGGDDEELMALLDEENEGLVILGNLQRIDIAPWLALLESMDGAGSVGQDLDEVVAFADIQSEVFEFFGIEFEDLALRVEPDPQEAGWLARISGEMISGTLRLPYDAEDTLRLNLEHLRLPETEIAADDAGVPVVAEEDRPDPLADIDPRSLPPLDFSADEISVGDRQFGSWRFRLTPTPRGAAFDELAFDFRGLRLGIDEVPGDIEQVEPMFYWDYDGEQHSSTLQGVLISDDIGEVMAANGLAASLISERAVFVTDVSWPGSPFYFKAAELDGELEMVIDSGRFLQDTAGAGALKLVSILNLSAIMRRARFSNDLVRRGLAFDEITGQMTLEDGVVKIDEELVISGPSSLYQVTGEVDLGEETIDAQLYVTLPVSDNIPWLGLLTANIPLAVGAYLFDQIFGDQVDSLTSAVYTLQGPWENLEPEFAQAFGSPDDEVTPDAPSGQ